MSERTKIEVWTKGMDGKPGLKVWSGGVIKVPSVGEFVVVFDGWAAAEVRDVFHDLTDGTASVEIGSDSTGEYAAKIQEGDHE